MDTASVEPIGVIGNDFTRTNNPFYNGKMAEASAPPFQDQNRPNFRRAAAVIAVFRASPPGPGIAAQADLGLSAGIRHTFKVSVSGHYFRNG